jgi:hypothetical protein
MRRLMRAAKGRLGNDRGATLAEYAIGFSLVVVVGLVSFNYLSDVSSDQANAQADCISSRPPPPSCLREPVPAPTTTTTQDPSSTTTTLTPPSTDPPPTTAPPPKSGIAAGTAVATTNVDGTWKATAQVVVTSDTPAGPVAGATVRAIVTIGAQSFAVECVTDAAGSCNLEFDAIPADLTTLTMTVNGVQSIPPAQPPYPGFTFTKP